MESDVRGGMLKVIGIVLFIVIVVYILLLIGVPTAMGKYEDAKRQQDLQIEQERERLLSLTGMELIGMANDELKIEDIFDELDFKLPFGCTGNVIKVDGGFEDKKYVVTIPFADENYMFDKNVFGDLGFVDDINYKYDNHKGTITISLNKMCEYTTDYDEEKFRLIFITPKQIYKKIILIDAGAGETEEINRDIAMRLKEKLKDEVECKIFYSGLEETEYRNQADERIIFSQEVEADYIISIQTNSTASHKMSAINGTQVAYQPGNDESKEMADMFQKLLVEQIGSSDKGIMEINEEEVYKDNSACSVVIKPGFRTNKLDMEYMSVPENRQIIADIIYEGIERIMRD